MKIYIASPYTIGDAGHNVRIQVFAAEYIVSIGHTPYVPLLTHLWHLISPHDHEYWLSLDREWVTACDALIRLPGKSSGADREESWALQHGMTIFYDLDEIPISV